MVKRTPGSEGQPSPHDISTKDAIIESALAVLGRDGFSNLTTRAIAQEAGVNQALINYHFGTKDKLLAQMLAALDSSKFGRQLDLYHEPGVPLSRKWRQAINFYREDLADGFVRITQELLTIGSVHADVAERYQAHLNRWRDLLTEVANAHLSDLGINLRPELVSSAVVSMWIGMSAQMMVGATEEDGRFFEVLDFIGDWLEERERLYHRNNDHHAEPEQTDEAEDEIDHRRGD
ncbi:MAG: TetR/AcrR family transcriptional regulator [Nitrolancea sp.]